MFSWLMIFYVFLLITNLTLLVLASHKNIKFLGSRYVLVLNKNGL